MYFHCKNIQMLIISQENLAFFVFILQKYKNKLYIEY